MVRREDGTTAREIGEKAPLLRVGVLGHTGYAGQELLAWLARHPRVEARGVSMDAHPTGTRPAPDKARLMARRVLAQFEPDDAGGAEPMALNEAIVAGALDIAFLATPAETSLELAPDLLAAGCRVIDISGAFRLTSAEAYERWYGWTHPAAELLRDAVYGLADLPDPRLEGARLIANPGCHATAVSLALAPLARAGLIAPTDLVACDCKSGVSGAGRRPSPHTHYCAVAENHQVYGLMEHRHLPEILSTCGFEEDRIAFSVQLLPVRRGLMATCYLRLAEGRTAEDLAQVYAATYETAPFVRVYPEGSMPNLASVVGSNRCHIGFAVAPAGRRVVIASVIDNLVKGAAGQAMQNMNLMLGLNACTGLREGAAP